MADLDDAQIEPLARSAYNAAVQNETDDGWWDKFTEGERDEWRRAVRAVLAPLAETGLVLHRFHHWRPQPGWPYDERARVVCTRCGAFEDGLGAQVTSCPIPPSADESK